MRYCDTAREALIRQSLRVFARHGHASLTPGRVILGMPVEGHTVIELDVPDAPGWWRDGQSYDLGRYDRGLCRAAIHKTPDPGVYIYVEIAGWPSVKPIEMPIAPPKRLPINLFIGWGAEGVRLRAGDQPPIVVPWQERPGADPP